MSLSFSLLVSSVPNGGRRRRPQSIAFSLSNSWRRPVSFDLPSPRFRGFNLRAAGDGEIQPENANPSKIDVSEDRGLSTLPDRFRGLTREAPDRPLRWPWLVALGFVAYTWRAVLWELTNWKTAVTAIGGSAVYLFKLVLGLLYRIIGPPITALLSCVDFLVNLLVSVYSSIVAATPVPELLWVIILAVALSAAAEAASPGSVNSQQHLLSAAGLLGYAAVGGAVCGLVFWPLVCTSFVFAKFVQKRDIVEAALPAAALLVSVGETWLRVLTLASFLGLAVLFKSTSPADVDAKVGSAVPLSPSPPVPLQLAALAIGIHLAAKWLRHRHLTWMIV